MTKPEPKAKHIIPMPELSAEQRAYLENLLRPAPDMNRVIGGPNCGCRRAERMAP